MDKPSSLLFFYVVRRRRCVYGANNYILRGGVVWMGDSLHADASLGTAGLDYFSCGTKASSGTDTMDEMEQN